MRLGTSIVIEQHQGAQFVVEIQGMQATRGTQEAPGAARQRGLGRPFVVGLVGLVVAFIAMGAVFVVLNANQAPPALPAPPPRATNLGAGQVTDQLGGNLITSIAIYRVATTPAQVIAYYRRVLPGNGGQIGRFTIVVRNGTADALPIALQHLPRSFVDGQGAGARANYTFTEYATGGNDVGIAVDLRHPHGPTLVFVDMLSQ